MKIHHLAVLSEDPERLAAFYERLFQLPRLATHHQDDGRVRSVWLGLDGPILMIERTDNNVRVDRAGWHLVALHIEPEARAALIARCVDANVPIEAQTDYTFYVRDVDGNRVGLSHYPAKPVTLSA